MGRARGSMGGAKVELGTVEHGFSKSGPWEELGWS